MSNEVISALEDLEKQKGIPKEYMLEKVEAALLSAVKNDDAQTFVPITRNASAYILKPWTVMAHSSAS